MTTYRLVRTGNTGNSNSYTAGGGIAINGDTISTNPTEDLVISGDKIGIKPTYVQDNFYITGTTLVREVADGTKVNLDFTDLINHINSNSGGDTSELENIVNSLQNQVSLLDSRVGFPVTYSFIDSGDSYLFTSDNGYYFELPKPKYNLLVDNGGHLTLTDEVFGFNTNVQLPQGSISYDLETYELTYDPGVGDGAFSSAVKLPRYVISADRDLIGIEESHGATGDYIELGEGLSSDIRGVSHPSYGGKLTNTGQVVKLTDSLGKSMLLSQGGDISSPEYKTGYYYVEGNDLPSNPIQDGMAYYVTKEYYGSMNFKLTATHSTTGRTFVGVNSDMTDLVWKELTTEA